MRHMTRLQARIRQMESEPRRQCFVEGVAWIGGYLVIFCQAKGDNERNRAVLAKELEAAPGWSCAAMVSLRCWHT